jgi:hypothetical protein
VASGSGGAGFLAPSTRSEIGSSISIERLRAVSTCAVEPVKPRSSLIAGAALTGGAVAALMSPQSADLVPLLAIVLAIVYGICKTGTA